MEENFESHLEYQFPEKWKIARTHQNGNMEEKQGLFEIKQSPDWDESQVIRQLPWKVISQYPALLRPLNRNALSFDGQREYLAAEVAKGYDLSQFTLEAWVNPVKNQRNPILIMTDENSQVKISLNRIGKLIASIGSDNYITSSKIESQIFTHIAVSVSDEKLIFYLNGQQDGVLCGILQAKLYSLCLMSLFPGV